jgi:hypothetical protein
MKISNEDITRHILVTLWRKFHYISVTYLTQDYCSNVLPAPFTFIPLHFLSASLFLFHSLSLSLPFIWFHSFDLLLGYFSPFPCFPIHLIGLFVILEFIRHNHCADWFISIPIMDTEGIRQCINEKYLLQCYRFITRPRGMSARDMLNMFIIVVKIIICIYLLHVS